MTRIVMAYTRRSEAVTAALDATGEVWYPINVSSDDEAYWRLFRDLWGVGEGWVNVEHDVIIHEDVLPSFEACPEQFCAYGYPYLGTTFAGLGCCRFSAELTRQFPDAVKLAGEMITGKHPARHWCILDNNLEVVLRRHGITKHRHHPDVQHEGNNWPSHGCHGEPPTRKETQ